MTHRDPYDVLEVHPSADLREIKKAYRKLARRHHPDAQGDAGTAERFIEIRRAYEAIVERRGGRPETAGADAGAAAGTETAEGSSGFEYDVDFGDEAGGAGSAEEEAPWAAYEPMGEPGWRGYVRDTWSWLVAELWSLILIAVMVLPMVGIGVLCRWYLGMRWFLFLGVLWLLALAIIRPDRWQRN